MTGSLVISKQLIPTGWACLMLAIWVNPTYAASNEELLKIIDRLESRLEQLESEGNITKSSEPESQRELDLSSSADNDSNKVSSEQAESIYTSAPIQPLELIPKPPTGWQQSSGKWALFLNIGAQPAEYTVNRIAWKDVRQTFPVLDDLGRVRNLEVMISMSGEGFRKMIGRSLLRRPQYGFEFKYTIDYTLMLDGKKLMNSQRYLSSDTLQIDKNGKLPPRLMQGKENQFDETYDSLGLNVHYGCSEPLNWDNSNLGQNDASFEQLNGYACLLLDFEN